MKTRSYLMTKQLTVDELFAKYLKTYNLYDGEWEQTKAALSKLVEEVVIGADLVCDIKVDHIKPGDSHGFCFRHGEVAAINKEKALMRERARKAGFSV
jgi:hypothetical protein